ncbi:uncharacterized protein LOC133288753 [Gastrolobium bilobum]|uniref:uncharacterized protein LOC133288753 n=1 Tax=Gastrolobium bilobum TaxID=150636 RepID=UPI002AB0D754|nr:uncharacterized protein LOC133288753 [Gastrolobium bilobum]
MTPFQALYGRAPPLIPHYPRGLVKLKALDSLLNHRNELLAALKTHLERDQNRMHNQADKHHNDHSFQVGDMVLVKLQPYRQITASRRSNNKLAKHFYGPYPIQKVISSVAYQLQLPEGCKIHPTFHILTLRPFHGNSSLSFSSLPLHIVDNKPVQLPIAIVSSHVVQICGSPQHMSLVQWSASRRCFVGAHFRVTPCLSSLRP